MAPRLPHSRPTPYQLPPLPPRPLAETLASIRMECQHLVGTLPDVNHRLAIQLDRLAAVVEQVLAQTQAAMADGPSQPGP